MDADGTGRKQFQLPNDGYILAWRSFSFEKAVSPDGKWLAFFTGSMNEPYDLTLNLFNLENETTLQIARLMAPGFPENLEPVKTSDPIELEGCVEGPCRISLIQLAFVEGIQTLDWSPDSQSLAFAAQIDGPSTDVYIFDVQERSIRRLVDDLENVWLIDWSPNGEKILYQNSTAGATYISTYLYIADPKIKSLQNPPMIEGGLFWRGEGWITENSYLILDGGEGAPPHNFRYINVDTQEVKEIWKYAAESFFIDSDRKRIFLRTFPEGISGLEPEPEEGLYFLTFDGIFKKVTSEIYTPLEVQGPLDIYFALLINSSINDMNELITIESDGTIRHLSRRIYYSTLPVTSPDGKWVLIASNKGTELYSENLQLVKSWDIYNTVFIWRPDSLGSFVFKDTSMYYLSISNSDPILIEDCAPDYCSRMDSVWLP